MSTYPLNELMRKWTQGDMTPEQAIGHILQHLNKMNDQMSTSAERPEPAVVTTRVTESSNGRRVRRNSV